MAVYFRIPDSILGPNKENLDMIIKKIGLLFVGGGTIDRKPIPSEKDKYDQMQYEGRTMIMVQETGYKYSVSSSNDHKIGEIDLDNNIYCLHYRYGTDKTMRNICKGICSILNLQYIEYLDIVNMILNDDLHPILMSNKSNQRDAIFDAILEFIEKEQEGLKMNFDEFKSPSIQDYVCKKFKHEHTKYFKHKI